MRRPPSSTLFPYTTLFRSSSTRTGLAARATARTAGAWSRSPRFGQLPWRSEEHTSELQSRVDLVCRLLLEKKKNSILFAAAKEAMRLLEGGYATAEDIDTA